jgi:hypothetical protein
MADEQQTKKGNPQITSEEREHPGSRRDPEERQLEENTEYRRREQAMDKTLADSFPTSDPPSSIPNPGEEEDAA